MATTYLPRFMPGFPPCLLFLFCLASLPLFSQQAAAPARAQQLPSAKNLKVLTPDVNVNQAMQMFATGLGVQCNFCHTPGDFAGDGNVNKQKARQMLIMMKDIASRFPDSGNDFPNS